MTKVSIFRESRPENRGQNQGKQGVQRDTLPPIGTAHLDGLGIGQEFAEEILDVTGIGHGI